MKIPSLLPRIEAGQERVRAYLAYIKSDAYRPAPLWKRFAAILIDITIIYTPFIVLLIYSQVDLQTDINITFAWSLIYLLGLYLMFKRSLGDWVLRIKPIFPVETRRKAMKWFGRTIFQSICFVPYLPCVTVVTWFFALVFSVNPLWRGKRIFFWDFSYMVVVEDDDLPSKGSIISESE